jgi:hypothetical protein
MEQLIIRKLNDTDYDYILSLWWKDWRWTPPLKNFLPDNGKGGVIIFDKDVPICAGFLYITNSDVCWVDWIISSRTYTNKPIRKQAIKLLIETLTIAAKDIGFKYCYSLIKNESLINAYQELGFIKGSKYSIELIKSL